MAQANVAERNQQILVSYEIGEGLESLGIRHGLKPDTVLDIIAAERHRRFYSPKSIYGHGRCGDLIPPTPV
jgi:hypothetical protein